MKRPAITFTQPESTALRRELEYCLRDVFQGDGIKAYASNYQYYNGCWNYLSNNNNPSAYPQLKLAYNIWLGMHTADRHAVLAKFQELCALCPGAAAMRKTMIFSALFINEFTGLLTAAMEWPE